MSVDLYSLSLISHINGLKPHLQAWPVHFIIIYNLYRGKAPVTGSDFQGGPLRVKIKYTKAKNIQYN